MGTWGTRIYEDDTALEVRSNFLRLVDKGFPLKKVEDAIIGACKRDFPGEPEWHDVTILALCCVELESGRLTKQIKTVALEIISSKRQYDFWIEYGGTEEDAKQRLKEMTLIRKYIHQYESDGKPIKRKSWLQLQEGDDTTFSHNGVTTRYRLPPHPNLLWILLALWVLFLTVRVLF